MPHKDGFELAKSALPLAFDATMLCQLVGDNPVKHQSMLKKFLTYGAGKVAAIQAAAAAGDISTIAHLAHALKSSARYVGALELGECCATLEEVESLGEGPSCQMQVQTLSAVFARAADAINTHLLSLDEMDTLTTKSTITPG